MDKLFKFLFMKKYSLFLLLASLFLMVACQQKKKAESEAPKTASTAVKTNQAPSSPVGEWVTLFDGISGAHWKGYGEEGFPENGWNVNCLLYTSPSPRDATLSRMPSSA